MKTLTPSHFVLRTGWGARAPRDETSLPHDSVDTIFFHYSAANSDEQALHRNCAARVRGIQTYHMEHNGWNDIAYSHLLCKHGYIFRGRGFQVRSAATGTDNDHSVAVCFLGDDTQNRDDVTAMGRAALVEAAAFADSFFGRRLLYKGHRDAMSTNCPGDEIYNYIHSRHFRDLVTKELRRA